MSLSARGMRGATVITLGLILIAGLLSPAASSGSGSRWSTLTADEARFRRCHGRLAPGRPGVVTRRVQAPVGGWVTARLAGERRGDWDLAVFELPSRRLVGASAGFGMREVAQGIVAAQSPLVVQACRLSGRTRTARLALEFDAVDASVPVRPRLVRVAVRDRERLRELQGLGLDLTEHGGDDFREVVLYDDADAAVLRAHDFAFTTEVADLTALSARQRKADRAYAATVAASELPSGRTTYRTLADYGTDMKELIRDNPGLVRGFTLPHETMEGRDVDGIEIATDVDGIDGRPGFLQMGLHHAREWPSGEHAMEWAWELVNGYNAGTARATRLVETTRTIVVPVVNPDGFNISREAGELQGAGGGRGDFDELVNIAAHPYEYRRKNCRLYDDSDTGDCLQPSFGVREPGVDLNRNYGGFWGGAGTTGSSATGRLDPTYRGKAPFSEPETQNVRELIAARQVTALVTNHTYSNLVLRPPGIEAQGKSPDEALLKSLGSAMTSHNGYRNIHGYQLYDTTGTTEDWSYWSTGGLGYTFEIGPDHFHPAFQDIVDEWTGDTADADALNPDSRGNREAYYLVHEAAADPAKHSVIEGRAPAGTTLRLWKSFETPTSIRDGDNPVTIDDTLSSLLTTRRGGRFVWHVNPSTRPVVAPRVLTTLAADPTRTETFTATAPVPGANDLRVADVNYDDHAFTIAESDDRAGVKVRIEWAAPGNDHDLYVYRRLGERLILESSSTSDNSAGEFEEVVLEDPLVGSYVARVVNWAALTAPTVDGTIAYHAAGADEVRAGSVESWNLECIDRRGSVVATRRVTVDRGQRVDVGAACARGR